jgi:hypothetical protein
VSVRSGSTRTSRALVNRFRNFRSDRFTATDLKQLTSGVPSVSITLDGRLAVSVGNDMTLRIWGRLGRLDVWDLEGGVSLRSINMQEPTRHYVGGKNWKTVFTSAGTVNPITTDYTQGTGCNR